MLAGCAQPQSALQRIRARGELRVVTLNAPTSYYLGAQGPQGFEYRLAAAFARQLQVRLVMEPLPDAAAMRAALSAGRADMAAAHESWVDELLGGLSVRDAEQMSAKLKSFRSDWEGEA